MLEFNNFLRDVGRSISYFIIYLGLYIFHSYVKKNLYCCDSRKDEAKTKETV